jgi:hypothetical protein
VTNKDGQAFNIFQGFNRSDVFFVSQTTERWIATARLRLGYAADKWLFFVSSVGAWSGVDVTVWDPLAPAVTAHHYKPLTGWRVGEASTMRNKVVLDMASDASRPEPTTAE